MKPILILQQPGRVELKQQWRTEPQLISQDFFYFPPGTLIYSAFFLVRGWIDGDGYSHMFFFGEAVTGKKEMPWSDLDGNALIEIGKFLGPDFVSLRACARRYRDIFDVRSRKWMNYLRLRRRSLEWALESVLVRIGCFLGLPFAVLRRCSRRLRMILGLTCELWQLFRPADLTQLMMHVCFSPERSVAASRFLHALYAYDGKKVAKGTCQHCLQRDAGITCWWQHINSCCRPFSSYFSRVPATVSASYWVMAFRNRLSTIDYRWVLSATCLVGHSTVQTWCVREIVCESWSFPLQVYICVTSHIRPLLPFCRWPPGLLCENNTYEDKDKTPNHVQDQQHQQHQHQQDQKDEHEDERGECPKEARRRAWWQKRWSVHREGKRQRGKCVYKSHVEKKTKRNTEQEAGHGRDIISRLHIQFEL